MTQQAPTTLRRVALVTTGFELGGGIPTVARWIRSALHDAGGYEVDIHDLATSRRDRFSRRLTSPPSWLRHSLQQPASGSEQVAHWGANGVEVEMLRYRPRRELTRVLRRYDIVQVVAGTPALAAAVLEAGRPVALLTATLIGWERQRMLEEQTGAKRIWRNSMTRMNRRTEHRVLKCVDTLMVLNYAMFEHGRASGSRRVVKVYPGIDTERFAPAVGGWRPDGYLLSVCRLDDPRKGLERMIRAYAHMVESDNSIPRLLLAGRGRHPARLQNLVDSLGLSFRVEIRLNIDDRDLPEVYRGASVFLQTSYEEGLGISIIEAMACGLPVVSTETVGTRETVVDGLTGRLVEQRREAEITSLVAGRVFEVLRSDGIAQSKAARERSLTVFSKTVALGRLTAVYDQLLGVRPVSRERGWALGEG